MSIENYSFYYMVYVETLKCPKNLKCRVPDKYFIPSKPDFSVGVMTSEAHFLRESSELHFNSCELCEIMNHEVKNPYIYYAFFKATTKGLDYVAPTYFVLTFCSEECITLFLLSDKGQDIPYPCMDTFLPF